MTRATLNKTKHKKLTGESIMGTNTIKLNLDNINQAANQMQKLVNSIHDPKIRGEMQRLIRDIKNATSTSLSEVYEVAQNLNKINDLIRRSSE